jgi:hypothetical protein
MKPLLVVWSIFEAGVLVGVALLIALRFPENHVAFDVRSLHIVAAFGMLLSILYRSRSPLAARLVVLNLLFAALIALVDQGNILVDDEEWTRRGMPPPFSLGRSRP